MDFKIRGISRGMLASAVAISLGMTVLAQDSPRLRTPRRAFERAIETSNAADASAAPTAVDPNLSQGPGPGPIGPGPGCNLFPAPASVGTTVNLSYFGPPPSTTNQSLVGPVQLLKSGPVDVAKGTITIPLYLGHMKNGANVWYVLTDVDDSDVAASLGLNFSAKMTFMANAARTANLDPNGNVDYSKVHDQVVAIDPTNMTVTINLINGFSFGKPVWYMSMDTSIPLGAAIEHNTFAPLMAALHLGGDDTFSSPIERIFISTNGAHDCANPQRQGLSADLADGFRPNNVVGGIPTNALDYSPAWDAQLFAWTQDAINKGFRGQVREEFQILTFVQDGLITGPGGAKFGSSGFSINCSIVQRLN